jgi:hypothetical protein
LLTFLFFQADRLPEGEIEPKREKGFQGLDARQTLLKRVEHDLDHPHELDRHSCTGYAAYDKKEKKSGGGARNWGTTSVNEEDFEIRDSDDVEEKVEKAEKEGIVGEKAVTFDEYIEKKGTGEIEQPENESKAKITEEELLKDIGKAVPLQSQKSKEIDDRKEIYQKKLPDDYHVGMTTEHADLLGFKTGAEEEPKEEDIKEKGETRNPIKKVMNFFGEKLDVVGEKLGLKHKSEAEVEAKETKPSVNFQDEAAFPKLD